MESIKERSENPTPVQSPPRSPQMQPRIRQLRSEREGSEYENNMDTPDREPDPRQQQRQLTNTGRRKQQQQQQQAVVNLNPDGSLATTLLVTPPPSYTAHKLTPPLYVSKPNGDPSPTSSRHRYLEQI